MTKRQLFTVFLGSLLSSWLLLAMDAQAQQANWEKAIAGYAAEDAKTPPPSNAIVLTGSSTFVAWKTVHEDLAPLPVLSRALGGSTIKDIDDRLDTLVLKYQPGAVVLYVGDNDIGQQGLTAEQVLEHFDQLVSRLQRELRDVRIYVLAIKPSIMRWALWPTMHRANELMSRYCDTHPRLVFIDIAPALLAEDGRPKSDIFAPDNLHLNAKGYALLASVVKPVLLQKELRFSQEPKSVTH